MSEKGTIPIRYIKKKRRKVDPINDTGIVWRGEGDVQDYPANLAAPLLQHEDVWVVAGSEADPHAKTRPEHGGNDAGEGEDSSPAEKEEKARAQGQELPAQKEKGPEVVTLKVNQGVSVPAGAYYAMFVPQTGDVVPFERLMGAVVQAATQSGYSVPAIAIDGQLFGIKPKTAPTSVESHGTEGGGTRELAEEVVTPETVESMAGSDKDTLEAWAKKHLYLNLNKRFSADKLLDQMRLAAEVFQDELQYAGEPELFVDAYKQALQSKDMYDHRVAGII